MFDDILERKKTFLDYKNQKVKKVKNWDFSKGSKGFGQKFEKFSLFYFWQNQRGKCVWRYSRKEKSLFRLKKTES